MAADTVLVENFVRPGSARPVNRARYEAMREAMLAALPPAEPGLSRQEILAAVAGRLPEGLFPDGAGVTWWSKCVQLDLEAKGRIVRHGRPLRWRRVG